MSRLVDEFIENHITTQKTIEETQSTKKEKTRKKRSTKLALKKNRHRGKYKTVLVSLEG